MEETAIDINLTGFEKPQHKVAPRLVFAERMARAIGIARYAGFAGMSLTDAFLHVQTRGGEK